MFPIRDLNPSRGVAVVTLGVIVANVLVFVLWQPHTGTQADVAFLYRYAAIACELFGRHPLERAELDAGHCMAQAAGGALFPDKGLRLSVGVSMFLHGGLLHLAGNMWFLWIFGDNVEAAFGHAGYALLYAVAGVLATAGFVLWHPDNVVPLVGASGAIAGVLGAYLVLFPARTVLALWFLGVIPVPAVVFLGLWFAGQFGVAEPGVAWEAHVAGFLVGVAGAWLFRQPLLRRAARAAHRPPAR